MDLVIYQKPDDATSSEAAIESYRGASSNSLDTADAKCVAAAAAAAAANKQSRESSPAANGNRPSSLSQTSSARSRQSSAAPRAVIGDVPLGCRGTDALYYGMLEMVRC